jgi:hypothetical protein
MQENKEETSTNIQLADLQDKFDCNNEYWTTNYLIDRLNQHLEIIV